MIAYHPDEALLLAYAAGATDEAQGLIVATHMALCETCRAAVSEMEMIGGALLGQIAPEGLAPDALNRALAKLDAALPPERPRREVSRDGTPSVLRHYIGGDLADVRWRRMGPRLSYKTLFRHGRTTARLLRGVPGADTGAHSHRGLEYTLVLKGGFTDVTGSYGPGDMQMTDTSVSHSPIADPGEDCINLAVTTDSLVFENWLQKIAGPLFGF